MSDRTELLTRREALARLPPGALLAVGLWPGRVRGDHGGKFRFVVVNDTHYIDEQCGKWLGKVMDRIGREKPEFCLVAGDLTEHGKREDLAAVREVFQRVGVPVHVVIGNHDYATQTDRSAYEAAFPGQINYWFGHKGWQFIGLDTTEGTRYEKTSIQAPTLRWADEQIGTLDRRAPTVIVTHFPLGAGVTYRPLNADSLLEKFRGLNLRAVFAGHFHGYTERRSGETLLMTNVCCALRRGNHDNTSPKGFLLCDADGQTLKRTFVQVA